MPKGLNWDLWQGPAQEKPFNGLAFSPRWRFVKEYGNGQIGAQGVHQLDMIRWGLKLRKHPTMVQAMGGKYSRPTCDETHPTELNFIDYEDASRLLTRDYRAPFTLPREV